MCLWMFMSVLQKHSPSHMCVKHLPISMPVLQRLPLTDMRINRSTHVSMPSLIPVLQRWPGLRAVRGHRGDHARIVPA